MSALASLLVRDQVIPVRKVEDAIQRQVVSGYELDTVLLQMRAVSENVMAAYRAAVYGLLPATREEVMGAQRDVVRLVPRDVAERLRMIPLWSNDEHAVIAADEPLSEPQYRELGSLLDRDVEPRIVTTARLAAGLAHHYDIEMPAHLQRLTDKLRHTDPGSVPYVRPPEDNRIDKDRSDIPVKSPDGALADDVEFEPRNTNRFGFPRVPSDAPPASAQGGQAAPKSPSAEDTTTSAEPPRAPQPSDSSASDAVGYSRVVGVGRSRPRSSRPPPSGPPPADAASPERPAPTAAEVLQVFKEASDRDTVLGALLDYAAAHFEYVALFAAHAQIAEARDARGPGRHGPQLHEVTVPWEGDHVFAAVRHSAAPAATRLDGHQVERAVASGLGREGKQPALLLPIVVRGRAALILYGDRGGARVTLDAVPELLAVLPRAGDALERIILRKKRLAGYEPASKSGEGRVQPHQLRSVPPKRRATRAEWQPAAPASEPPPSDAQSRSQSLTPRERPVPSSPPPPGRGERRRTVLGMPTEPPAAGDSSAGSPVPEKRGDEPGMPPEHPEPSGPSRGTPQDRSAWDTLGVPRSAPPPPPSEAPPAGSGTHSEDVPNDARPGQSGGGSPDASTGPHSQDVRPPDAGAGERAPPEHPVGARSSVPPGAGAYSQSGGPVEVVRSDPPRRRRPSGRPRGEGDSDRPGGARDSARKDPSDPPRDAPSTPPAPGREARAGRRADAKGTAPDPRTEGAQAPPREEVVRAAARVPSAATPDRHGNRTSSEPSVVVDMGGHIEELVHELFRCGPDDEGPAVQALLQTGEAALPVLVQHFPGPLWFDRRQPHRRLPRGRDVCATARAFVAFGEAAVPYVASLLSAGDPETRFYATLLSSELVRAELAPPLAERVFDPDPGVRTLAVEVLRPLRRFGAAYHDALEGIRAAARNPGRAVDSRVIAIRALGELRDTASLDLLIEALSASNERVAEIAHASLVLLTRQDFGRAPERWTKWAATHRHRHRIEWLIDGLLHADYDLRSAAGEELKEITQEYYGFHPGSPKRERETIQRKYREWWEQEGRARFVG